MHFNIAICDDDEHFCRYLKSKTESILNNLQYEYKLNTFSKPEKMLEYIKVTSKNS